MAYIGNTAPSRFVSNRAASVYSGDGSTVAFTLEQAVVQDEDILVSVDGVVQEPSVAYAVSNATTLTFTAAPSSNSGNNIFVYYLASQVGTVGHPSSQALSATNGTFTGDVTIGDASASDKKILFDGNAQDYHIGLDDSSDSLVIGKGSALGTTTSMSFDANGIITKPLQPAFCAIATAVNNLAINTVHNPIAFGGERFDNNADFASNTFTAPVTGKYQLNMTLYLLNIDIDTTYIETKIVTSNDVYINLFYSASGDTDWLYHTIHNSVVADMDAGDTALITLQIPNNGAAQMDIAADSFFSGALLC